MTEQQNTIIHNMREQNFSYLAIARAMGALPYQPSRATVKGADLQEIAKKHLGAILLSCKLSSSEPPVLPSFCRCLRQADHPEGKS
jgi:hypothetical protein